MLGQDNRTPAGIADDCHSHESVGTPTELLRGGAGPQEERKGACHRGAINCCMRGGSPKSCHQGRAALFSALVSRLPFPAGGGGGAGGAAGGAAPDASPAPALFPPPAMAEEEDRRSGDEAQEAT